MKCPFTGKPCLLPKEVFVTEVTSEGVKNLFLCKLCGEKYLEQVDDKDVVTKSALEVISSDDGISHSERLIETNKKIITAADVASGEITIPTDKKEQVFSPKARIQQVQRKLDSAIQREDYESAAVLRDLLKSLEEELND